MNRPLKLGFIPLLDAAPLLVAQAKGMFAAEGLHVDLVREVSWATIRDKMRVGALDAAHMLAPMTLASALEPGSDGARLVAAMVLNRGGAAVTLSARIGGAGEAAAALGGLVAARRAQDSSPLTFAVVFPQSIHNYLLRRWLAGGGVDPDRDVRITVAPPSRMADLLADGVIEGFSAGEPWNTAAEAAGAGEVAARASALWPEAPDKVLGVREAWAQAEPTACSALIRAISAAGEWIAAPAHRGELLALLASPGRIGLTPAILAPGLGDIRFAGRAVNTPSAADADWLVRQMGLSGQLGRDAGAVRAAFRSDLYAQAMGAGAPGF